MIFLFQKNIILFSLLLLISINYTSQSDIHYIADASMNATATIAFLEKEGNNEHFPKQQNVAYFEISTEMKLLYTDFKHTFLNKEWTELTMEDMDENISWKNSFLIDTKINGNKYNYYIQVNKFGGKNKLNTLVMRIPILKDDGFITIANLNALY